jgi:Peptidase family M1 domain
MRKYLFLLIILSSVCQLSSAQTPYRSSENIHYWKNDKPHQAYWQQDIHYIIDATIDEKTDILSAHEKLIYYNNSPDTLRKVYFHLYQNAFIKDAFLQESYHNPMGNYQKEGLGIEIEKIQVNNNTVNSTMDNTILIMELPTPLLPNDSILLDIDFTTYFDINARWGRMMVYKSGDFKHYNGAHWYPRICVYDMKSGWNTDQHLGHEFYGDFGTFDVSLQFANNFIVDATGVLTNKEEILPNSLLENLNLSNFKDKEYNSPASIVVPYDSTKTKTWLFHAINVHDFAFIADPSFRIAHEKYKDIDCYAFVQESHAAKWQDAAKVTADIIQIFDENIGSYIYPKMTTGDCRSGMEYPMLTMNSGFSPGYAYIFTHEMGHNWFYGMLGSSETYRPVLDEGFTQYLTVFGLEELAKKRDVSHPDNRGKIEKCINKKNFYSFRYDYVYFRYLRHAIKTEGRQINTHADMFNTKEVYGEDHRQAYYKGATMLYNLKYVLGDSLFDKGMQHYVSQWKIAHPFLKDMRSSFINATHTDLNWFFDQWLETTKTIDYCIEKVEKIKGSTHQYEITIERKGEMQMPLDIVVTDKSGKSYQYYIPNTYFIKPHCGTVLPRWFGWDYFYPTYSFQIQLEDKLQKVEIDPKHLLADINLLDNSTKTPVSLQFDSKIIQRADWESYEIKWRPAIWWNAIDGIKAGIHLEGDYMDYWHKFSLSIYGNTRFLKSKTHEITVLEDLGIQKKPDIISLRYSYSNPVSKKTKNLRWETIGIHSAGLDKYALGLNYLSPNKKHHIKGGFQSMYRNSLSDYHYLLYPNSWNYNPTGDSTLFNNQIYLSYSLNIKETPSSQHQLNCKLKTSGIDDSYSYSSLSVEYKNKSILKYLVFNNRLFAQYSIGRNIPSESALYFSNANPEEMMDNPLLEAAGYLPLAYTSYDVATKHFHYGGGLNMRGYAGYLIAHENSDSSITSIYQGHSGIAWNTELEFDKLIHFKPKQLSKFLKFNTYLFADLGIISTNAIDKKIAFSNLRMDAGVGCMLTVKSWGPFNELKPFSIRFDMPFFLNRPPAVEDYFQFRWLIGISKAV